VAIGLELERIASQDLLFWPGADLTELDQHDYDRVTEDGAEAIALALAHRHRGWRVVRRLQREEHADWLLESAGLRKALGLPLLDGGNIMSLDSLHTLVTGAIWRAEQLEEHQVSSAPLAWTEVSRLEEELARALPASLPEGRIARRGAVRAALKARDFARADMLAERYLTEREAPESLRATLRELLEEEARALAGQFRYAAKQHAVREAREIARRLHQAGAFGLAA
jgi:hypothetical protein